MAKKSSNKSLIQREIQKYKSKKIGKLKGDILVTGSDKKNSYSASLVDEKGREYLSVTTSGDEITSLNIDVKKKDQNQKIKKLIKKISERKKIKEFTLSEDLRGADKRELEKLATDGKIKTSGFDSFKGIKEREISKLDFSNKIRTKSGRSVSQKALRYELENNIKINSTPKNKNFLKNLLKKNPGLSPKLTSKFKKIRKNSIKIKTSKGRLLKNKKSFAIAATFLAARAIVGIGKKASKSTISNINKGKISGFLSGTAAKNASKKGKGRWVTSRGRRFFIPES